MHLFVLQNREEEMKKYPFICIDIYESQAYPAVTHIFHGKTLKEANGYMQTHMKTDEFLRAAVLYQKYKGMLLHVEMSHG